MISFTYLALILLAIEFFLFMFFIDTKVKDKKRKALTDALTFNSGLFLFLYLFGKITSLDYFTEVDEFLLLAAIFIGSIYLMSTADDYYKNLRNKIKKLIKRRKPNKQDGRT